ncbi:hypothetical protein LOTGIDRAFT_232201 [Lottia gigantea]|uniref:Erythroid differentiation-related factor 1 n=1 Tax=Lottia gigantea TaxID=225164 RepID=V4ANC0_LOTGI|nr:hypothetical protein LOTGIDRAFT_232201 [Lottia gigantea]ESO95111.1 hypothetical protein LOTGIDRAFT_232201 [Lottia gigantea]
MKDISNMNSKSSDVKSTAVVKYQSLPLLAPFSILRNNTNLNIPPSNWLRSNSKPEQYVRDISWHTEHSDFSSFKMANNFIKDLTDDVDVVSDAGNIKTLLKMPFSSSSHVSMMVHRIGQTLLLDDFDIHKHLLRQEKEDWKWLRSFYEQMIAKNTEGKFKNVPRKSKSRNTLQNRNMFSKFLYHSLQSSKGDDNNDDNNDDDDDDDDDELETCVIQCHNDSESKTDTDQIIPLDPLPQTFEPGFPREVLWTFENIRMLIGADLPIFGGETHPCISLRLRNSDEPINVLTGLDYWLDNLMCNVPEVAMCFHLDGFVQKYELLKTEDIPNYKDCEFDPKLVMDIARNILSFLKSNATLEGHTYWLYKDSNDDVVKLYDLTTLCEGEEVKSNPFTVPVGILLYRVARNLCNQSGRKKTATIRRLLENSLLLLDEDKHSQVCTSAYYLLSDLYVPDSSIKDIWESNSSDESDDSCDQDEEINEEQDNSKDEVSVDVKTLYKVQTHYDKGWHVVRSHPIAGTVEERCQDAFRYIRKGLECLSRDLNVMKTRGKDFSIVEEQAYCDPNVAIPLSYEPLRKPSSTDNLQLTTIDNKQPEVYSWHGLSKCLLLRKAAMTFYSTCKEYLSIQKFGHALRQIRFAIVCFEEMKILIPKKGEENNNLLILILEMAGDIRLIMARNTKLLDEQEKYFTDIREEEAAIVDNTIRTSRTPEYEWVYKWSNNTECNLDVSVRCYEQALSLKQVDSTHETNLRKRLGNSLNELGVWYMNFAQNTLQTQGADKVDIERLKMIWKKSEDCFIRGKDVFQLTNDKTNVTLLLSNIGRLKRLGAQTYTQLTLLSDRPEFTDIERQYYSKAIECYQAALSIIKNDKQYNDISDSILWDLSTTYYNMAMLLQDYAPLSTYEKDEIEKDVIDYMNKSLNFCTHDMSKTYQHMCQYRSAMINQRLASLYQNTLRSMLSDQKKRYIKQLSESHYNKAITLFKQLKCPFELLRSILEKLALMEMCQTVQATSKGRIKSLCHVITGLLDCQGVLDDLIVQQSDSNSKHTDDLHDLLDIIKSKLQYHLLHIVKNYTSMTKGKHEAVIKEVKCLYAKSLQGPDNLVEVLKWLSTLLQDCRKVLSLIHQDLS